MEHRLTGVAVSLPCEEMKKVDINGVPVCVVRIKDGTFFAVDDTCSHEDASLSDGWVYDREVECPRHNSIFELDTGRPTSLPATEPVAVYPVTVDGDDLILSMNDATPAVAAG